MPTAMNTIVATSERAEPRESPQIPWPLVHPPPRRVPKPTSRPPSASTGSESEGATPKALGATRWIATPPSTSPSRNEPRHGRSGQPPTKPPAIPLMPAILRRPASRSAAARPIKTPPTNAGNGLKAGAKGHRYSNRRARPHDGARRRHHCVFGGNCWKKSAIAGAFHSSMNQWPSSYSHHTTGSVQPCYSTHIELPGHGTVSFEHPSRSSQKSRSPTPLAYGTMSSLVACADHIGTPSPQLL